MDPREQQWIEDGMEAVFGPWKAPTLQEETDDRAKRLESPWGRRPATDYGWGIDDDPQRDEALEAEARRQERVQGVCGHERASHGGLATTAWPLYRPDQQVRCCNCGQCLEQAALGMRTTNQAGHGAWRQGCQACTHATFYDVRTKEEEP